MSAILEIPNGEYEAFVSFQSTRPVSPSPNRPISQSLLKVVSATAKKYGQPKRDDIPIVNFSWLEKTAGNNEHPNEKR